MDGSLPNSPTLSTSDTSSNEDGIRPFAEEKETLDSFKLYKPTVSPESPPSPLSDDSGSGRDTPNRYYKAKMKGNYN